VGIKLHRGFESLPLRHFYALYSSNEEIIIDRRACSDYRRCVGSEVDEGVVMSKKFEMRRIAVWPVVRVVFIIFLIIGIVVGLMYGLMMSSFGLLLSAIGESPLDEGFPLIGNLGFLMIPMFAIFYAVFGTVAAVIWVVIYNITASVVGGIELELEEKKDLFSVRPEAPAPATEEPPV
jgi:hypothetical protein